MIRIRNTDGSVLPVPAEGVFVELVNDIDGSVQIVLYQPEPGRILQLMPGSKDAQRYQDMFASVGVQFTSQMISR